LARINEKGWILGGWIVLTAFSDVLRSLELSTRGKGAAFEIAVKWWLKNDLVWSGFFINDSVRLWGESPLRYGPDIGIDLTATDLNGGHWAIQVKNWNPDTALPKAELDSFLSASSTGDFVGRLLITTTNTLSANAKRTIEVQKVPCIVVTYSHLDSSGVWKEFSQTSPNFTPTVRKERPLLNHQIEAVESVASAFANNEHRGQLIMACGSGKTLTGQRIAEAIESERTLILLPSLLLLQQTLLSWRQDRRKDFRFIAVCSDESVGKDEFSSNIIDLPFPVTTDANAIANELLHPGPTVVFSTYQSSDRVSEAINKVGLEFDLVLADEAHRLAGISDGPYGTVLKEGRIPSKRFLFMTATPKVFGAKSKKAADDSGAVLWSMDDESVFGRVLYSYSFARAIGENRLCDYKVVVMGVSSAELRNKIEERLISQHPIGTLDLMTLAAHLGLAKAMEKYSIGKVISFHSKVSAAQTFSKIHPMIRNEFLPKTAAGREFYSAALSGQDPTSKRSLVLEKLGEGEKERFALVSNARCLTEGIDVPSLDGIAFIEPRSSQVDIVQAVGRAIRKSGSEKKIGYIVIPIFVSPEDIAAEKIDQSKFKPVWDVINALKSHDETLQLQLDELRQKLGSENSISGFPEKLILDIPTSLPEDIERHLEAFILENTTSSWEEMYGKAQLFARLNGHVRVFRESSDDNFRLAHWLTKQRTEYKRGRLQEHRVRKLESLPGWSWLPFDEMWLETFEILRDYVNETGSAQPPASPGFTYKGRLLGKWVSKQRGFYRSGQLDLNRVALLESLTGWSWDPFGENWMKNYELVRGFAQKLGHVRVPDSVKNADNSQPLNRWLIEQRSKRFKLPNDKTTLLESIPGWNWNPHSDRYEIGFRMLKDFIAEFGHSRVPKDWPKEENVSLHQFVQTARGAYRSGEMTQSRIDEFESLVGWSWNLTESAWDRKFQEFVLFIQHQKKMPSRDSSDKQEMALARWARHQRELFNEGKLTSDKIGSLEKIQGWQWGSGDNWDEIFKDLEEFINRENRNPPKGTKGRSTQVRLDSWYSIQKKEFSILEDTRQTKLRSLPYFVPLAQTTQSWPAKFIKVLNFIEEHGTIPNYPNADKEVATLGLWLMRQKSGYNDLSEDKKMALASIPGFEPLKSDSEIWYETFNRLKEYVGSHEGSLPTRKADLQLANWLYRQSSKFHKLPADKRDALMTIQSFRRLVEEA